MKTPVQILKSHLREITSCRARASKMENTEDIKKLAAIEKIFQKAINDINTANRRQSDKEMKEISEAQPITVKEIKPAVIRFSSKRNREIILPNGKVFQRLSMQTL